jgi:hypothetical protein
MGPFHAVIIGGGGTGAASPRPDPARDEVTLIERGELTSGDRPPPAPQRRAMLSRTGSGEECIENTILRRIAPGSFELNDGLFVADR